MDRGEYLGALVGFGRKLGPSKSASEADRTKYLARIVGFAGKLQTDEQSAAEAGVEAFRPASVSKVLNISLLRRAHVPGP